MFAKGHLSQVQVTADKQVFPSSQQLPWPNPLDPGDLTHPGSSFQLPPTNPPKGNLGRMAHVTRLAGVTFLTTLAGTTIGQAPRFPRQIGTWEDPWCNSPYMVAGTMEAGSWVPWAGSASTCTCIQCPQMSVWLWIFMDPNGGMMTLCVVWTCPWLSTRQNPLCTVGSGTPSWGSFCIWGATGVTKTWLHWSGPASR